MPRLRAHWRDSLFSAALWSVLALACLGLRDHLGGVLAVWLPSGVAVAAFRIVDRRHWHVPGAIFLLVQALTVMVTGVQPLAALAYSFSSLLQTLICAAISIRVLGGARAIPRRFAQVAGVFGAAIAGCLVGALVAIPFRAEQSLAEFGWWFFANVLGILIVTPALVDLRGFAFRRRRAVLPGIDLWFFAGLAASMVLGALALQTRTVTLMPLLMAAMVGMGVRYGQFAIVLVVLGYATLATMFSLGGATPVPFLPLARDQATIFLQSWLLTTLATALPIAAATLKREELQRQLLRRNAALHDNLLMLDLSERIAGIGRWRLDLVTGAQEWSARMLELNGLPPALSADPGDVRHLLPDNGDALFDEIARHRHERAPFTFDYRIRPAGGIERTLRMSMLNEFDEEEKRIAVFGVAMDVTDQVSREAALDLPRGRAVRLAAEAQKLANTDPLTSLPNRRCTFARLDVMVAQAQRRATPLSAIMFDIDRFKAVNDCFGHRTGDEVIQQVANFARAQARKGDVVGRIGGEEFVWLLPGVDAAAARTLAERLRKSVEGGIEGSDLPDVTISVGLAQWTKRDSGEDLLAHADAALYDAKNNGRNQVRRAA